jgi:hypothetical protein
MLPSIIVARGAQPGWPVAMHCSNRAAAGNTGRALRTAAPGRDLLPADPRSRSPARPRRPICQGRRSSQHLVAVRPGGLGDEPRRQIYAGHPASCPRIRLTATFLISPNPQNTTRVHRTTTWFRPVPTQITQADSGLAIPCGPRAARALAVMLFAGNDPGRLPRAMLLLDARWPDPDVRAEVSRWPCRNGVAVARTRRWRPTGRGGRRLARGWW